MSRDWEHGGDSWSFPNCVWAPSKKRNGNACRFWEKILQIKKGDIILHLRGKTPNAYFVGYSVAAGDGYITPKRPPEPKQWEFAESFYRADLLEYTEFYSPINLSELFNARKKELEAYFKANKDLKSKKSNIFFVIQSDKLRCLNGAYLSDVDDELLEALFEEEHLLLTTGQPPIISVNTSAQLSMVKTRLGQSKFSEKIKNLYEHKCCFPGCKIADSRFLVASHIARWCDNAELRGHLGNGLCFCLFHDKAFELGLFTIDEEYKIFINPKDKASNSIIINELSKQNGKQISIAKIKPLDEALLEHWSRVGIEP
jgi:hypothetical protein